MYQKREERKQKKLNSGENSGVNKIDINWYPGHMAKTKREIKEKLPLIDIVYELVDARIPRSSRIDDLDNLIKKKPRIIIMTKYDLCDEKETNKFIADYQKQGLIVLPLDLKNKTNLKNLFSKTNNLLQELNNKRNAQGLKSRNYRALVIGVPNVGKSTLINRLAGKTVTAVGNKAGITKSLSWIRINPDLELLDTPGILWPKISNPEQGLNLATFMAIKEEILDVEEVSHYILKTMSRYYLTNLHKRYGLVSIDTDNLDQAYQMIAQKRGLIKKDQLIDYEKTYQIVINDLKDGLLGKVTFDRKE